MFRLVALLVLAMETGCVSFHALTSARTLPAGESELLVAPVVTLMPVGIGQASGPMPAPNVEVGLRHGLSDSYELGGKVWLLGAQLDGKLQLLRADDTGLSVSLGHSLSYIGGGGSPKLALHLPLYFGFVLPGGHELVFAPRVAYAVETTPIPAPPGHPPGSSYLGDQVLAGGALGVALRMGPRFRLMPEAQVRCTVLSGLASGGVLQSRGGCAPGAALGLLF
jgi:hypothetical protein